MTGRKPSASARTLLDAFATYMRRVLADAGEPGVVSTTHGSRKFAADTVVGIATGNRTDWGRRRLERRAGLVRQFSGASTTGGQDQDEFRVEIFDRFSHVPNPGVDPSFDVLAILAVFNECDIIRRTIEHLLSNGVRVHVLDNWSTDATPEIVREFERAGKPVKMEKYPAEGPSEFASWELILQQVEVVAAHSGADWIIRNDADEFRVPCWPGMTLRDALWIVDQWEYNCIDHTVINFRPVEDNWSEGDDPFSAIPWGEFADHPAYFLQLSTWKAQPGPVGIDKLGGHEAAFEGRRIFPYKFVNRHYPIRSQAHGERKVHKERAQRWSPDELAKGWHSHYRLDEASYIWNRESLFQWEDLDKRFLLQRLSGVGLLGNPRPDECIPGSDLVALMAERPA